MNDAHILHDIFLMQFTITKWFLIEWNTWPFCWFIHVDDLKFWWHIL